MSESSGWGEEGLEGGEKNTGSDCSGEEEEPPF